MLQEVSFVPELCVPVVPQIFGAEQGVYGDSIRHKDEEIYKDHKRVQFSSLLASINYKLMMLSLSVTHSCMYPQPPRERHLATTNYLHVAGGLYVQQNLS